MAVWEDDAGGPALVHLEENLARQSRVVAQGPKNRSDEQEFFIQRIQFIREHGKHEEFWGHPYIKLICDGFKYWSNGWPLDVCVVINRAEHPSPVFDETGNRL